MKTLKAVSVLAVCAALALFVVSVMPIGSAQADAGGGLVNKSYVTTLSTGVSYTTTGNTGLSTLNVFDYGAVQIHVQNAVTGTQVLTVTPQFSNQPTPLSCSAVTSWYTATEYTIYPAYTVTSQVVTSTGTLTATTSTSTGALTTSAVNAQFTVSGSDVAAREVAITGRCFRVKLDFSAAGQVYTPTVYVRPINRY